MRKLIIILFCLALYDTPLLAAAKQDSELELTVLYNLVDPALQHQLTTALTAKPKWKSLIRQKRLAVGIIDLNSEPARFARVNGNVMMYAASLPKLAILMAAYASFDDGSLKETEAVHKDLADMIRISSNEAATRMIDLLGYDRIAQVLSDPRYGFYDESMGGGFWIGKRYAATGLRRGDPMHNISHGATVNQTCRFYYLLAKGKLINEERSRQMLEDLSNPQLHHKFVSVIEARAPDAQMFRKSGTWKVWHADSIMVHGPEWRNYILTAMVESPDGEQIIRQILPLVEDILHKEPTILSGEVGPAPGR